MDEVKNPLGCYAGDLSQEELQLIATNLLNHNFPEVIILLARLNKEQTLLVLSMVGGMTSLLNRLQENPALIRDHFVLSFVSHIAKIRKCAKKLLKCKPLMKSLVKCIKEKQSYHAVTRLAAAGIIRNIGFTYSMTSDAEWPWRTYVEQGLFDTIILFLEEFEFFLSINNVTIWDKPKMFLYHVGILCFSYQKEKSVAVWKQIKKSLAHGLALIPESCPPKGLGLELLVSILKVIRLTQDPSSVYDIIQDSKFYVYIETWMRTAEDRNFRDGCALLYDTVKSRAVSEIAGRNHITPSIIECQIECEAENCERYQMFHAEVSKELKVCSGCRIVYYCSRTCQKAHWKEHKKICKKL